MSTVEQELKITKDAPTRYHFKTKDDQRVAIEHKDRQLVLGLYKWGEEASLKMFLNMVLSDKHQFLENMVEIETPEAKMRVYPIDVRSTAEFYGDPDDMLQCTDGGLRFDLVLKAKPLVNSFTIPIKSKNLRFSYQPFLTEQDIAKGTIRPFNVEGSYAIYHISKKNNQYMTGKAFHIYRPIAEDALGNKSWCSIHIDAHIEPTSLTVTVPQQFLDEATYPVTIDPDFGYQSEGGTEEIIGDDASTRVGSAWTMPAPGGTANYIRAYVKCEDDSTPSDCKVFINQKDSGGISTHGQIATKENLACGGAVHWEEFTLAGEALTEAVDYILNIMSDITAKGESYRILYDVNGTVSSYYEGQTYADPENPWVNLHSAEPDDYSIYCNYSEAPVVEKKHTFRLHPRPGHRMEFHPNLKLG